jgi:hypothetical protein
MRWYGRNSTLQAAGRLDQHRPFWHPRAEDTAHQVKQGTLLSADKQLIHFKLRSHIATILLQLSSAA